MAVDEEEAHHLGGKAGQHLFHREEISQGLGHLFGVDGEEAVVQPVAGKRLARGRLRLGQFVFMVGEDQVLAAAVQVEGFTQVVHAHGGALDMPARPSGSPGAVPGRFPGLAGLPQHEIQGVFFVGVNLDPRPGFHVLDFLPRELAVSREAPHPEEDVAPAGIGKTQVHQALDEVEDLGDMLRGLGLDLGRRYPQGGHVLLEGGDVALGHLFPGYALFLGPAQDLVVDVGKIAHPGDLETPAPQIAHQDLKGHTRAGMAQMDFIINRHPTGIEAHFSGGEGLEGFFASA